MLTTRVSRRTILKAGALGSASLAVPWRWLADAPAGAAFSQSDKLRKFIQPLRNPVLGGIPLAAADTTRQPWWQPRVTHYTIDIGQFTDQLHPDLPNPTRLWGFGQNGNFRHLGGIIAAKRGRSRADHVPQQPATDAHPPGRPLDHGHRGPGQPGGRPPPRRLRALDERRRSLRLVGSERPHGPELPEQLGPWRTEPRAEPGRVLLPERPERPADVVPRPRQSGSPASTRTPGSPLPTSSTTTTSWRWSPRTICRAPSTRARSTSSSRTRSSSRRTSRPSIRPGRCLTRGRATCGTPTSTTPTVGISRPISRPDRPPILRACRSSSPTRCWSTAPSTRSSRSSSASTASGS